MKKRILFPVLLLVFCLIMPFASAVYGEEQAAAEVLYQLGLFRGTGTNSDGTPIFDLDRVPSRNQAVIMLVRLLGKEEEALTGTWETPFTDVDPGSTPAPYVGYAYAHGLTKGTTETTYSGVKPVTRNQYLLFLMRVMGYDQYHPSLLVGFPYENGESMTTADAATAAGLLGLTDGMESDTFTRGEIALLSYRALDTFLCGKTSGSPPLATLREALGLGDSPRMDLQSVPVEVSKYDSYEEADAAIQRNSEMCRVLKELPIPGGTLISYRWGGIPHGPVNRVWAVYQDGTVLSLPLPRLGMGQYAQAEVLAYDAETNMVSYEADIPDDLSGYFGITRFRRAGTYHYTCDLNARTAVVTETELAERIPETPDPAEKVNFTVQGEVLRFAGTDAITYINERADRIVKEIPIYQGTLFYYEILNRDAWNREIIQQYLAVARDDGAYIALPFARDSRLPDFNDPTFDMSIDVDTIRYDETSRTVFYEIVCKTEQTERIYLYAFDIESLSTTVTES